MKKGYKNQILDYDVEKFNLIVKNDINIFVFSKSLIKANKNILLKVTSLNRAKKIWNNLKNFIKKVEYI